MRNQVLSEVGERDPGRCCGYHVRREQGGTVPVGWAGGDGEGGFWERLQYLASS